GGHDALAEERLEILRVLVAGRARTGIRRVGRRSVRRLDRRARIGRLAPSVGRRLRDARILRRRRRVGGSPVLRARNARHEAKPNRCPRNPHRTTLARRSNCALKSSCCVLACEMFTAICGRLAASSKPSTTPRSTSLPTALTVITLRVPTARVIAG